MKIFYKEIHEQLYHYFTEDPIRREYQSPLRSAIEK